MKHFPILDGRCYVEELPEGATNLQVVTIHQGSKSFPSLKYDRPDLVRGFVDLPPGTWEIVGRLSEMTEEQVGGLVDEPYTAGIEQYTKPNDLTEWSVSEAPMGTKYSKTMYNGYRDYTKDTDSYSVREANPFLTALDSLESAIMAEGYTFTPSLTEIYDSESECMRVVESPVLSRDR